MYITYSLCRLFFLYSVNEIKMWYVGASTWLAGWFVGWSLSQSLWNEIFPLGHIFLEVCKFVEIHMYKLVTSSISLYRFNEHIIGPFYDWRVLFSGVLFELCASYERTVSALVKPFVIYGKIIIWHSQGCYYTNIYIDLKSFKIFLIRFFWTSQILISEQRKYQGVTFWFVCLPLSWRLRSKLFTQFLVNCNGTWYTRSLVNVDVAEYFLVWLDFQSVHSYVLLEKGLSS